MQLSEVLAALDALPSQARQEVIDEAVKASAGRYMIPNPGPQTEAWLTEADETFYGGAAGGGKTTLICGLALEDYQPALILRRQATQLKGIEDELTRMLGGRDGYNSQSHVWRLANGGKIELGGVPHEADKEKYQGRAHRLKAFEQRLMTLRTSQEARIALNEAIDGLARGEDIRLSPNGTEPVARIAAEVESLSRAYDEVLNRPTGPVDDPLVRIEPGDIDALIVARGAFRKINELEFSKSGKGLVKVIWAHGEKSAKDKAFRVTKDDLVALPDIVREFEPVPSDSVRAVGDTPMRTWRVERNGRVVVYGDKGFDGGQQLVTVHIDKGGPDAPKLSEKKKPAPPDSRPQVLGLAEDTAGDRSIGTPGVGQAATGSSAGGQSLPAAANIAQRPKIDNSVPSPEPRPAGIDEAEAAVARTESPGSESLRTLAQYYGVDPDSGAFAEATDIAQLAAEGRLSPADVAAFDAVQDDFEAGSAFAEALKSVASCLT